MPLLEIVKTEKTSPQTLIDLLGLAKAVEKIPLVVKSYPGFAVNRLFVPYLMTATLLVDLGLDLYRVDAVIKEFGMPMGPFRYHVCFGILLFENFRLKIIGSHICLSGLQISRASKHFKWFLKNFTNIFQGVFTILLL
jgi:3-hydroxyacyl-CoA dehydrogenase